VKLAHVYVNHEGLIFQRGRIFPESFALPMYAAHFKRPTRYLWFLIRNYVLRREGARIPSALWVVDNLSAGNYFHWISECLPRLLVAEHEFPLETTLVLPRGYARDAYVQFSLKAFPRISNIEWIEDDSNVRVHRLAFVRRPTPSNVFDAELINDVGRRLRELAGAPSAEERIYFSRADARHRRAVNEEDVVRVLRSHGFRIVRMDPRKPEEQVRAVGGAKVICGVHGAALTNLIFMPSGGEVLEFRHPRDELFPACYGPLAVARGHTYRAQLCEPVQDSHDWIPLNHSNLIVDLDVLRDNLRRLPDSC
jgi:capsular polysaccharide biosynthesis protein